MTDTATAPEPTLVQKLSAEVLGTFVLVFIGVGAAMSLMPVEREEGFSLGVGIAGVALAFGFAVLVMAYAVGHISGGHFNPAVSLGAALAGRISWVQAGMYAAAQVVGAIVGAAALFAIFKGIDGWEAEGAMGQNGYGDESGSDIALWSALLVEVIATAVFLYVILAATDKRNPSAAAAPVAIGIALAGIHLAVIPLTGTSVNPARSLGPALFAGSDSLMQVWVFILAPMVGAAIAGFTYALIFGSDGAPVPGSGLNFGGTGSAQATGFAGGWDPNAGQHPGGYDQQQWGGAPQGVQQGAPDQQWGQPAPEQQWGSPQAQPEQQWNQPQGQPDQQQWGAPPAQPEQQQWGGQPEQQWGGPQAQPDQQQWNQPQGQPDQQQWGAPQGQPEQAPEPWSPPEDDGSRTQIRQVDDGPDNNQA